MPGPATSRGTTARSGGCTGSPVGRSSWAERRRRERARCRLRTSSANSSLTGPSNVTLANWGVAPTSVPAKSGNALDSLRERLMVQNQYANRGGAESLWITHTVANPGNAGLTSPRWYQFNVTGDAIWRGLLHVSHVVEIFVPLPQPGGPPEVVDRDRVHPRLGRPHRQVAIEGMQTPDVGQDHDPGRSVIGCHRLERRELRAVGRAQHEVARTCEVGCSRDRWQRRPGVWFVTHPASQYCRRTRTDRRRFGIEPRNRTDGDALGRTQG